jgi:eukaryotic-like serine/threonine-protein kinase
VEDNPRDDGGLLEQVASRIDDNQPIDWESAEDSVDDQERAVLAELRVLAALARVYRDPEELGVPTENDSPADPSAPPLTWGTLTVLEPIGRGAFAQVYRARDNLQREVALKLFPTGRDSDDICSRVLREGSLLAKVKHRNVVVVFGVDIIDRFVGLWMEFISGRTMEQELRSRGTLGAEEATTIGLDLCRALSAVHARGLLHRDIKAQNVMREDGGRTVLMDFGAGTELVSTTANGTAPGDLAGTPLYLAPELFERRPASRASDIYSLGVLLYRMVTGGYPVDGADRSEIAQAHRNQRRRRLRDVRPDLDNAFVAVVERMLAPRPEDRFQSAAEVEEALVAAAGRRLSWWQRLGPIARVAAIAAAVVLIAALPVWWILDHRQQSGAGAVQSSVATGTPPVESPAPAGVALPPYSIKATFFKHLGDNQDLRLLPGDRVEPNDAIGMRIEASTPVHVYVVTADDRQETRLLFPLEGYTPANPLPAAKVHQLPGSDGKNDILWQVTSVGIREHFLVMASPDPLPAFEAMLKTLPAPALNQKVSYTRVPESVIGQLRGVGGLVVAAPKPGRGAQPWFGDATILPRESETVRGPWVRQLVLENRGTR